MRRFEFSEGKSDKFWEIQVEDNAFTVRYGPKGKAGQSQTKTFADAATATREAEKLVAEKLKKGYAETQASGAVLGDAASPAGRKGPKKSEAEAAPRSSEASPALPPQPPQTTAGDSRSRTSAKATAASTKGTDETVTWTDAMRARTHGLRGFWHAPLTWNEAAVLERIADPEVRKWHKAFRFDEHFAPYKERLIATPAKGLYRLEDDPKYEGMRAVGFHLGWTQNVVAYWGREKGAAFALEALYWQHQVYFTNFWMKKRDDDDKFYMDTQSWRALRQVVAAADDASYRRAVEVGARLRRESGGERARVLKLSIAFAFPQEPWALEDVQELLPLKALDSEVVHLLAAIGDVDALTALARRVVKISAEDEHAKCWGDYAPDIVARLGTAAVAPLLVLMEGAKRAGHRQQVAEALALIDSDEVTRYFVKHLAEKHLAKPGAAYLARNLDRFIRVTAASPPPEAAAGLLAQLRQKNPQAFEATAATIGIAAPRSSDTKPATPEAAVGALPAILARPPWIEKLKRKPVVIADLAPLDVETQLTWGPEEREKALTRSWNWKGDPYPDPLVISAAHDAEVEADLRAWLEKGWQHRVKAFKVPYGWSTMAAAVMELTDEAALARLRGPVPVLSHEGFYGGNHLPLLARFGLDAVDWILQMAARANSYAATSVLPQLDHIIGPATARTLAPMITGRKDQRPYARAWFLAHPDMAAIGAIPLALGAASQARSKAEIALRWLARQGHRETIEAVAKRYGGKVPEGVAEILESDLGFDKMPKLPAFWTPAAWSAPTLRAGGALPASALEHLGTMLAVSSVDDPHYGLEEVRGACDPRSLAAFGEDLFNAWLVAGGPAQQAWAFHALALVGDDETVRKLVAHMHKWPAEGAGGRSRTMTGLEILAAHGSDLALLNLQRFAQTARIHKINRRANELMDEVAQARGLTLAELEDRLVPTLGLAPDGSMTLDFGPRRFSVRFDENLRPFVLDDKGERLGQFPKATRTDDADKAKAAAEQWKALEDAAEKVAQVQVFRLEQAMCAQRRWSVPDFRRFLVDHPLLGHLAPRLLWGRFRGSELVEAFRIDEERRLLDADDRPFSPPPDASIGIPHRLEMSDAQASQWGQVFADYGVVQPFAQLGRDTYPVPEDKRDKTQYADSVKTRASRLKGLQNRGWRMAVDDTWVHMFEKNVQGGASLTLTFEPGWDVSGSADAEQTAKGISSTVPLGDLPPIAYSEMARDYQWLGG